jgi:xanthine dehydrogenase accessory factor
MTIRERVIQQAAKWMAGGKGVALATITHIKGSSSQPLASRMAVCADGEFVGFVSGGCVEADVARHAVEVARDGGTRLLNYHYVPAISLEIGLNCEGTIDLLVEPATRELVELLTATSTPVVVSTSHSADVQPWVNHRRLLPSQPTIRADSSGVSETESVSREPLESPAAVSEAAHSTAADGVPRSIRASDGTITLVEPIGSSLTLLIVSASAVAYPLATLAKALGYRVVISDPRADYLRPELFPDADQLLAVWPRNLPDHMKFGPDCMVVSLNHEAHFEDDLFQMLAMQPSVGYLGAMGKARRRVEREERLRDAGIDLAALPEAHTPIGLDLGGKQPEEVALAIMAEIQSHRFGRRGGTLRSAHAGVREVASDES